MGVFRHFVLHLAGHTLSEAEVRNLKNGSGRGTVGKCTGPKWSKMVQNGQNDHFLGEGKWGRKKYRRIPKCEGD